MQLCDCILFVGVTGFEPATTWSQTRCATGLRYAPIAVSLSNDCAKLIVFIGSCKNFFIFLSSVIYIFVYESLKEYEKDKAYISFGYSGCRDDDYDGTSFVC